MGTFALGIVPGGQAVFAGFDPEGGVGVAFGPVGLGDGVGADAGALALEVAFGFGVAELLEFALLVVEFVVELP